MTDESKDDPQETVESDRTPNPAADIGGVVLKTYLDDPTIHLRGDTWALPENGKEPEHLLDDWRALRQEIVNLPSDTEGINLKRMWAYCRENGIPYKPLRFLNPAEYAWYTTRSKSAAQYLSNPDVVIAARDRRPESLEGLNGPEFLESLVVHELAHGDHDRHVVDVAVTATKGLLGRHRVKMSKEKSRMGFIERSDHGHYKGGRGFALEEAYAEFRRGQYVVHELGRTRGFLPESRLSDPPSILDKYAFRALDGKQEVVGYAEGAKVAAALELLIAHDPELLHAIEESRHSEQGDEEVKRRLDAIKPGLGDEFLDLDIKNEGAELRAENFLFLTEHLLNQA